jgi:hypothetical protein
VCGGSGAAGGAEPARRISSWQFKFAAAPGCPRREQADIPVAGGERACVAGLHAVSHYGLSPKPAVADPFISVMEAVVLLSLLPEGWITATVTKERFPDIMIVMRKWYKVYSG